MELVPRWLFMSFWAITGLTFLKLGLDALDRTHLSDSVSPFIMFLFKHALALSLCHSSHYVFVLRPGLKVDILKHTFWVVAALDPLILFTTRALGLWYFLYCAMINLWAVLEKERPVSTVPSVRVGLEIDFIVKLAMYCIEDNTNFYPTWLLSVSVFTSSIWHAVFDDETMLSAAKRKENPMMWEEEERTLEFCLGIVCAIFFKTESSSFLKKMLYKRRELVKFGIGMFGTILFQNFFRLTTFDHVLAFLHLAVAWLANLALLRATDDFGVLNFLLANVIVGCTVSQFGLQGPTWLAFGASLVLFALRLMLRSMSLADREAEAAEEEEAQAIV